MSKRGVYKTAAMGAIHETASALHDAGLVKLKTMRDFDELCLTKIQPLNPEEIRAIRTRERVSQAIFARHLNVTTGIVSKWERGEKNPTGPSLKLLTLVKTKGLSSIA